MKRFALYREQAVSDLIVEPEAYEGVRRIAGKVAADMENVFGAQPRILDGLEEAGAYPVICATLGKSPLVDELAQRAKLPLSRIQGKRECYFLRFVRNPRPNVKCALLICGSDKRGTIYGMFHLSELMGVSPWYDWADVAPKRLACMELDRSVETVSKEPSVRYRGFFINDEWPSFGTWAYAKFKGFNAQMYDKVFELLLRLKGNYLWPAMWSASFPLDGPGLESAELADIYGVVMGTSHHEPCLRASEEWDIYKGESTPYGTEWNYHTNKEGLLRYWKDGLARSGHLESVITIGMRGERDTSMLGEDSSLKENIDLLKDIISNQRRLIRENVPNGEQAPLMMALYKEVEAYYYGDSKTEGLQSWEGLDGVTLMLCEDNYGNMRTLPTAQMRKHNGGFGMYYHFDYHGGPISYEWVNSTPLSKVWEQMTMAYDYGVRDIWIVNVGDLKPQELPLSYFMELAYDFEKWGTKAPNMTHSFTKQWVEMQFGAYLSQQEQMQTAALLEGYTRLNGNRRPEALNRYVYHPTNYNEAAHVLEEAQGLYDCSMRMMEWMPEECADTFYELVHFPVCASANVIRMQILAGWNELYAAQGNADLANACARLVGACIRKDKELTANYNGRNMGKWYGMSSSAHVGFINWNDEGWSYPVCVLYNETSGRFEEITAEEAENDAEKLPSIDEMDVMLVMPPKEAEATAAPEGLEAADETLAGCFIEQAGYIAMEANHYAQEVSVRSGAWERLTDYGRTDSGMKVYPVTKCYRRGKGPKLVYQFAAARSGTYVLECYLAPTNALVSGGTQCFGVRMNDGRIRSVNALPEDFAAGNPGNWKWSEGVLDNIHKVTVPVTLRKGVNRMSIYAEDAGVVLERFVLWRDYENRKHSYLGPPESYRAPL